MGRFDLSKKIGIAFIANICTLFCNSVITFILPKQISVNDFSYFQLYVFFTGYVSVLGFGIIEGVYLEYGGQDYEEVDNKQFSSIFFCFLLFEVLALAILLLVVKSLDFDNSEKMVVYCFGLCALVYLPRAVIHNLFLATGKIHEYSIGIILDKTVQIVLTVIFFISGRFSFIFFIACEIIGRVIGAFYIFSCSRGLIQKINIDRSIIRNLCNIFRSGLFLLVSNISNIFIIGVVRWFIERAWDVETFGKISLTISISNLLVVFINSVSLVLFPYIKKMDSRLYSQYYFGLQEIMSFCSLALLLLYYPMKVVLTLWIPEYGDSIKYMSVLLPICFVESKMQLIENTFYKALRLEKKLMRINVVFLLLSVVGGYYSCFIVKEIGMAIASILLVLILRYYYSHYYISHMLLSNRTLKDILEILCVVGFVLGNVMRLEYAYFFVFFVYCCFNFKDFIKEVGKMMPL